MKPPALSAPVRLNYHAGMVLGVDDFAQEQRYVIDKQRLHSRLLHGPGVVCGLEVTLTDGSRVRVEPGVAIDPCGREVVVTEPQDVELEDWLRGDEQPAATLCLHFAEEEQGSRIREAFELDLHPGRPKPPFARLEPDTTGRSATEAEAGVRAASAGCDTTGSCVPLATLELSGKEPALSTAGRPVVCDSGLLLELVLRLFDRVHALEQQLEGEDRRPC